jgi:hypothetical protein
LKTEDKDKNRTTLKDKIFISTKKQELSGAGSRRNKK